MRLVTTALNVWCVCQTCGTHLSCPADTCACATPAQTHCVTRPTVAPSVDCVSTNPCKLIQQDSIIEIVIFMKIQFCLDNICFYSVTFSIVPVIHVMAGILNIGHTDTTWCCFFNIDSDKIFDSFQISPFNSYSISCPSSNSSDEEKTEPTHTYWIQPCYHLTDVRFRRELGNILCLF